MSENEKKFSNYQTNECKGVVSEPEIEEVVCPTCTPDPNWTLDRNWFVMEDPWLDEATCEYKISISPHKANAYTEDLLFGDGNIMDYKEDVCIDFGLRKILIWKNKLINSENIESLLPVTILQDVWVSAETFITSGVPGHPTPGESLQFELNDLRVLISVSAQMIDTLEEAPEIVEPASTKVEEIIIDGEGLGQKLLRLRLILNAYEKFYAAFRQYDEIQIYNKNKPLEPISYRHAIDEVKLLTAQLNNILGLNDFEKIRVVHRPTFGMKKELNKLKIVFEDYEKEDDTLDMPVPQQDPDVYDWGGGPFTVEKNADGKFMIFGMATKRCDEWELLDTGDVNLYLYRKGLAFLARIDDIMLDADAQKPMSWLEWTVKFWYPELGVDYGTTDPEGLSDAEKRSSLECFLQDSLGLDPGEIINSVADSILSALDFLSYEAQNEACRATEDAISGGDQAKVWKDEEKKDLQERMQGFLDRETKKIYDDCIRKEKRNNDNWPMGAMHHSNPNARMKPWVYSKCRAMALTGAREKADKKFPSSDQEVENPWVKVWNEAKHETIDSDDSVMGDLKKMSEQIRAGDTSENVQFFIDAFGVCGLTKLSGAAIKCLLGGMTMDDFLSKAIEAILNHMKIEVFEQFYGIIPDNYRRVIDDELAKNFKDVKIMDLIKVTKEYNGNRATLGKIISSHKSKHRKAFNVLTSMEDPRGIPIPWRKRLADYWPGWEDWKGDGKWTNRDLAEGYDWENKTWRDPKIQPRGMRPKVKVSRSLRQKHYLENQTLKKARIKFTEGLKAAKKRGRDAKRAAGEIDKTTFYMTHDEYAQVAKDFKETNLGTKIDPLISAVFVEAVESILNIPNANIWDWLQMFPIPQVVINLLEGMVKPCPQTPLTHPPVGDFLKGLTVDVCDPTFQLKFPKIVMPPIDWKFILKQNLRNVIIKKLQDIFFKLLLKMLKKILQALEDAICNILGALGEGVVGLLPPGKKDGSSFIDALNEAYCGDQDKAEKAAVQLLGRKAVNVISSVATVEEILDALISPRDEQDDGVLDTIATAIRTLTPELEAVLGTTSNLGYWFEKTGSFLSPDDKERIRELLEDGVPNLPISAAICLTNEQLDEWNKLREALLRDKGLTPEQARAMVDKLNKITEEALEEMLDFHISLQTDEGPFAGDVGEFFGPNGPFGPDSRPRAPGVGADDAPHGGIDDVYGDDECDDFRAAALNDPDEDFMQTTESGAGDRLLRRVRRSYLRTGGLFNEVMQDVNGVGLRKHARRSTFHFLYPNYHNSQEERDEKYDSGGKLIQFIMEPPFNKDADGSVVGNFPPTVGYLIKEEADKNNLDFSFTTTYRAPGFESTSEYDPPGPSFDAISVKYLKPTEKGTINMKFANNKLPDDFAFESETSILFGVSDSNPFNYLGICKFKAGVSADSLPSQWDHDFEGEIPIGLSINEQKIIDQINYNPANDNPRATIFNDFLNYNYASVIGGKDYKPVWESAFKTLQESLKKSLFKSDNDVNLKVPPKFGNGFRFGYVPNDITKDDWKDYVGPNGEEYNYRNSERVLGKYKNPRIVVLDPAVYGGRYTNPPYYIEPAKHFGWMEVAGKLFGGNEGCEPKSMGALSFKDIGNRITKVRKSLTEDVRLSKHPDCYTTRPFNHLLMPAGHAHIEGVVRSTCRVFASEEFLKGYGVFSNMEYRAENYDPFLTNYIVDKMRESMWESGGNRGSRRIRVKGKNYWYLFLEQAVQTYQRMIDIDGITPPPHIEAALEKCYLVQRDYTEPNRKLKKKYLKPDWEDYRLPGEPLTYDNYDMSDVRRFIWDSLSFRIYGDSMFYSDDKVRDGKGFPNRRVYRVKKLVFFTKIFAIHLVEKECKLILAELVASELRIISKRLSESLITKPYYNDLSKALLSMPDVFPNSSLTIGTRDFEVGQPIGECADVPTNNSSISPSGDARFVLEKYIRLKDKPSGFTVPSFISNRPDDLRGVIPLKKFEDFLAANTGNYDPELKLSDCFGDLQFVYSKSMSSLYWTEEIELSDGTTSSQSGAVVKQELIDWNPDLASEIENYVNNYSIVGTNQEDFQLSVTDKYLRDFEQDMEPSGTIGNLGIFYGLRVCIVPPSGMINIAASDNVNRLSQLTKSLRFNDGVSLPIAVQEVGLIDSNLQDFTTTTGDNEFDLACLLTLLSQQPEFTLMFDKILGAGSCASMCALYCISNFDSAAGFGNWEKEDSWERDPENMEAPEFDPDEGYFDGIYNKRVKNYLRREFSSFYMSNDADGQIAGDMDEDVKILFNPFKGFELGMLLPKIRLLKLRRMRNYPFDANGMDCADPLIDFT